MKYLREHFRNFESEVPGRFIFTEVGMEDKNPGGSENTEKPKVDSFEVARLESEEIDAVLDNKLSFSISSLRRLEKSKLNAKQKSKFRKLVDYYISLSNADVQFSPPRVLAWVYNSPELKKFLGAEARQVLEFVISKERKNLQELLSKKESQWSDFELSRVCSLYNILRKKKNGEHIGEILAVAKKKIIERGKMFFTRAGLDPVKETQDKASGVLMSQENEKNHPLTLTEKLILVEIRALFPTNADWSTSADADRWGKLTQETVKELLTSSEKQKQKPHYALAWEMIGFLKESLEKESDENAPTENGQTLRAILEEHRNEIQEFIEHGNKIQFLAYAETKAAEGLSRTELNILQEIKNGENKIPSITIEDWKIEDIDTEKVLEGFYKELEKLKQRKEGMEKEALDEVLKKELDDEKEEDKRVRDKERGDFQKTQEVWEERQEALRKNINDTLGDFITDVLDDTGISELTKLSGIPARYDKELGDLFETVRTGLTTCKNDYEELQVNTAISQEEKTKREGILFGKIKAQLDVFEANNKKNIGKDFPSSFQVVYESYTASSEKYETMLSTLKNKFEASFSEKDKAQIQDIETKISELDATERTKTREEARYVKFSELYKDVSGKAKKIESKQWEGFDLRVKNHTTKAVDFDAVFTIYDPKLTKEERFANSNRELTEEEVIQRKKELGVPDGMNIPEGIKKVRQRIQQLLNTRIKKVIGSDLLKKDVKVSYKEWYELVYREFSYNILGRELGAIFGINQADVREKGEIILPPHEISVLLEGAMNHFREHVIEKIGQDAGVTKERAEELFEVLESMYESARTGEAVRRVHTSQEQFKAIDEDTKTRLEEGKKEFDIRLEGMSSVDVRVLNELYNLELSSEKCGEVQTSLDTLREEILNQKKPENTYSRADEYLTKNEIKGHLGGMFSNEKPVSRLAERLSMEQTNAIRVHWANEGHLIEEEGEGKVFIPGRTQLNKFSIQTVHIGNQVGSQVELIRESVSTFHEEMKISVGIGSEPGKKTIEKSVKKFVEDWDERGKHKIRAHLSVMRDIAKDIFDTEGAKEYFIDPYFKQVFQVLNDVDRLIKELKQDGKVEDPSHYKKITERLNGVVSLMDIRNGALAGESNRIADSEIGKIIHMKNDSGGNAREIKTGPNKGLETLEKYGYFEGEEKFKENFEKVRNDFSKKFKAYEENIGIIFDVVSRDMKNLDENAFHAKYNMDMSFASSILDDHRKQKEELAFVWTDRLGKDEFYEGWLAKLRDDNPASKNDALIELGNLEEITEIATSCSDKAEGIKKWLADYKDKKGGFHIEWKEQSLYSIYMTFKISFDAANKHWKRNNDRNVADLGTGFFGTHNRFGKEFVRMQEESENERVKEFETQYHDAPGWVIWDAVGKSKNQDEVRACINLLNQKGFLKWDDPLLWKALNRLQRSVKFNLDGDMHLTPLEIKDKVSQACTTIWTTEIFNEWNQSLESNQKKAQDGYAEEFRKYENDGEARFSILSGMLQRWGRGESANVEPAQFAGFLKQAFIKGKMNGNPDGRFYLLIQGMTLRNPNTGQTLLSRDILNTFGDDYLARFPHVEFFSDKKSPKHKGKIVPEGYPGAEKRDWNQSDFEEWASFMGTGGGSYNPRNTPGTVEQFFFKYIHMSSFARDRVQRMQRFAEKEGDHDDAWSQFLEFSQAQIKTQLSGRSEGTNKNSPDYWRTFISIFPRYMVMMNEILVDGDAEYANVSGWKMERERILQEVGSRMKVGMTLMQSLLGNYVRYHDRPYVFGSEEWKKQETGYSFSIMDGKENVNTFMRVLFGQSGNAALKSKYEKILDYKGYEKGTDGKTLRDAAQKNPNSEHATIMDLAGELLDDESVNRSLFGDSTNIEQALKQYVPTVS